MRSVLQALLLIASLTLHLACSDQSKPEYLPEYTQTPDNPSLREYVFGVHPLHNPERLHEVFAPIMEYLSQHVEEAGFRLEASRNYSAFDEKLYSRRFDFALPNPYQTVLAVSKGYRVFGKMGDDENFRGIILIRKDSGIRQVADLRGKAISFPAASALAATMMPQYFLQRHGLRVMSDVDIRYVGSQESSIMNVYLGNVSAGATWPPPWRAFIREHPDIEADLKIIWQTDTLPNNALVARDDIEPRVVEQVAKLLFSLHETEEGRVWLKRMELSRFEAADERTYDPVRSFLKDFARVVRPVELP